MLARISLLTGGLLLSLTALADTSSSDEVLRKSSPASRFNVANGQLNFDAPVSLTPEAADALRHKVLVQCGMADSGKSGGLPWYFHFEYGRALLQAGDASRAVHQIAEAATLNPQSQADKRMYGMWYADYFPYVDLAMAHAQLGNWPCAADALKLAETQNSGAAPRDSETLRALKKTVSEHAAGTQSCRKEDVIDPAYDSK